MLLITILIPAFVIGLLRGGRVSNLLNLRIRHVYLMFFSALIDYSLVIWVEYFGITSQRIVFGAVFFQYLMLFLCLFINRKLPFAWLAALGSFLNYFVIMLNGGRMPLSRAVLQAENADRVLALLQEGKYLTYALIQPDTLFWYLGDVLYIPKPVHAFISIGDILLYTGVFLLLQQAVAKKVTDAQ